MSGAGSGATVGAELGIRALLADRLGAEDLALADFRRHIEGFSWETYSMTAIWSDGTGSYERGFVVHRVPGAGLLEPYDVESQFALISALGGIGAVPVPTALWSDPEGAFTGRPAYVVEKVAGDSPTPWTIASYLPDDAARRGLGEEFAALGAKIHALPIAELPADLRGAAAPDPVEAVIAHWEEQYLRNRFEPAPAAEYLFAWLRRNASLASGRIGVVHGDFRVGNFMVTGASVSTMLDWELTHVGDPVEDLACATLKTLRGKSGEACGLMPLDDFIAAYEAAAGWTVPREAIQYWWVMFAAAGFAQWLTAVRHFHAGATIDVRYATLGYQLHYLVKDAFATIEALRTKRGPWPAAQPAHS